MEEEEEEPIALPFDRSKGSVGNFKTKEVIKITDPDAVLSEDETFIISDALTTPWKQFLNGEFEVRD